MCPSPVWLKENTQKEEIEKFHLENSS